MAAARGIHEDSTIPPSRAGQPDVDEASGSADAAEADGTVSASGTGTGPGPGTGTTAGAGTGPAGAATSAGGLDESTSGATAEASRAADAREHFGEYELLEEIARGGMGVVYRARQTSLNRIVALKMILTGRFATEDEVRRFHSEAEAAASLSHAGIVQIYDVDTVGDQRFFSMEFIDGQSLADRLVAGPLVPDEAATIMAEACDAIEFAHQKGIVHRDLKPANLIIDEQGHPHITDFGLARRKDTSLDTGLGELMGTVSYMPPEQAAGQHDDIGPHSDVYSLGATLYSLLVGHPPFHSASTADTLMQVINHEPVPLRQLNSSVPGDLETICLKCLEKQPSRRYGSALELGLDLRRFLNNEPISARPASATTRLIKWTQRNPRTATLVCVLIAALVALFASGAMYNRRLAAERQNALEAEQRAHQLMEISTTLLATIESKRNEGSTLLLTRATNLGRLASVTLQLLEQEDRSTAEEAVAAFSAEATWFADDPSEALPESIRHVQAALEKWDEGSPPDELIQAVNRLIGTCRSVWSDQAESERATDNIRRLVAARLAQIVELIIVSRNRSDAQNAIQRFERMRLGLVPVVGLSSLQELAETLGGQLDTWDADPPPEGLIAAAKELRDQAIAKSETLASADAE